MEISRSLVTNLSKSGPIAIGRKDRQLQQLVHAHDRTYLGWNILWLAFRPNSPKISRL
jgi:hypothetical protein